MLLDLLIIALLVSVGHVFFAAAAAIALFSASARQAGGGVLRRTSRYGLRLVGAIAAFVAVLAVWSALTGGSGRNGSGPAALLERDTVPDTDVVASAHGIEATPDTAGPDTAGGEGIESMIVAYGEHIRAGDTVQAAALLPLIEALAAAPSLGPAEARSRELASSVESLTAELRAARSRRGRVTAFLSRTASDLGLGFGWSGLYFTALTVLMRGQTPGKRLFRLRVIRLDGRPIGWWAAFARFGGYSASLATGLLGFAQLLWDRNRQTLQDKLADTVVVLAPRRGPEKAVLKRPEPGSPPPHRS